LGGEIVEIFSGGRVEGVVWKGNGVSTIDSIDVGELVQSGDQKLILTIY
jgi:hypothetical protein